MTNELDYQELDKDLDRTKTKVFLSKNAAFLGSLMCSLTFAWVQDIKTACTNGIFLHWNPNFFKSLSPETRITVLMHELWHVALLHMLRRNGRDPYIWNIACDYFINNMLDYEGYLMTEFPFFIDHIYDNMAVEEIYDILMKDAEEYPYDEMYVDIMEPTKEEGGQHPVVAIVVQATAAAAAAGGSLAGNIPGEVETLLKKFLQPKLPWERLLLQFFNELSDTDYSWARPNRRYSKMYLPSLQPSEGLDKISYYLDVSGSVSDAEVIRFNSEIKHIKDTYNPVLLTLILFDTNIRAIYEYSQEDLFEELIVVGRGGTSLVPVRDHIIETEPDAVIIFSDLHVTPMEVLPKDVPIIWVAINNHSAEVNMGKLIHIKE